ncbi:MAG TPA: hypothetical protein VFR03_19205 [Thermoanaerobaculia bacterium]|nr:hypothetical protein [Thermoanaerobaculia bacterium]
MAKQTTYTGMIGDWQTLLQKVEGNIAEIPQLEPFRAKLTDLLGKALDVTKRQAGLKADKQEASKQMRQLAGDANRLANAVRVLLKEHYGIRDEKLSAFGLQPFRGRPRKTQEPETPPPTASPNPAQS